MNKNGGNPRGCALGLAGARFVDHVGDCIHLYGIEIEIIAFNPVHVNARGTAFKKLLDFGKRS